MRKLALFLVAAMVAATPAKADWLERAGSDELAATAGSPAITLSDAGVLLVLPEVTLAEAHAAGRSTQEAVQLLVQRYGQHCSDALDLDRPHAHLRVRLFLQKPADLADAPERVQGEVLDALKATRAKNTKKLARVERLFVASDDSVELFIDYVPARRASCVQPGAEIS